MKRILSKILCKLGWHNFTYSIQDCIDEFGFIPIDNRMPKTAKCKCGAKYKK